MHTNCWKRFAFTAGICLSLLGSSAGPASARQADQPDQDGDEGYSTQLIPNTGQLITPTAPSAARFEPLNPNLPDFPEYIVGQAVTTVESPDGKTLLILTSGYNRLNATCGANVGTMLATDSNEYVFVYDVSEKIPVKKQLLQVPNTYNGITFDPSGKSFCVSAALMPGSRTR